MPENTAAEAKPLPFEFWVDELVERWSLPRDAAIDFVEGVESWACCEMLTGR